MPAHLRLEKDVMMAEAKIKWLQNKQFVGIDSSRHSLVLSAQDEANGIGCKPSDMLLLALASCTAVDVVEILSKKRTPLDCLEIDVKGEQNADPPWAFYKIHLSYHVRGMGLTPTGVEQAIRLSEEKYCSVAATIRGVADISWDYQIEA
jgi:putative redox protein